MLCFLKQPKGGQHQFKDQNNQNCQKIKLYGSPTTKELKKKHSPRLVGGAESSSQGVGRGPMASKEKRLPKSVAGEPGRPVFTGG